MVRMFLFLIRAGFPTHLIPWNYSCFMKVCFQFLHNGVEYIVYAYDSSLNIRIGIVVFLGLTRNVLVYRIGYDRSLPNPFLFRIHLSYCHSTQYYLKYRRTVSNWVKEGTVGNVCRVCSRMLCCCTACTPGFSVVPCVSGYYTYERKVHY